MTNDLPSLPRAVSPCDADSVNAPLPGSWAERLEVFYGQATPGECRLYVRLAGLPAHEGWRLTGRVRGPECRYAQTLPADYPLQSREPGADLLAEAFIPDPCFWSPALPQLYEATLELVQNEVVHGRVTRMVGIRTLGARSRSLYWEGKRWVLRGVHADEVANACTAEVNAWHEGPTAMLTDHPADELCQRASLDGALIVARVSGPPARLSAELARLARWPSVGVVVVDQAGADLSTLRRCAGNMLIAQFVSGNGDRVLKPAPGAQAVVWELVQGGSVAANVADLSAALRGCPVPLIAYAPAGPQESVVAGRAACDRLQSQLASAGDFAGYIV